MIDFHAIFFYRLWHIRHFIHKSLGIIYGFRLDSSKYMLLHTHIKLRFTQFVQQWIVIDAKYSKYGKSFIEMF